MLGLNARVDVHRDVQAHQPEAERQVFGELVVALADRRIPVVAVHLAGALVAGTVHEDRRPTGAVDLVQRAGRVAGPRAERLHRLVEVEQGRVLLEHGDVVLVIDPHDPLRERQRAHDRPRDRIGDRQQVIDDGALERHVRVDPEQPLGAPVVEELGGDLVTAIGDVGGGAPRRDLAFDQPLVPHRVVDEHVGEALAERRPDVHRVQVADADRHASSQPDRCGRIRNQGFARIWQ